MGLHVSEVCGIILCELKTVEIEMIDCAILSSVPPFTLSAQLHISFTSHLTFPESRQRMGFIHPDTPAFIGSSIGGAVVIA